MTAALTSTYLVRFSFQPAGKLPVGARVSVMSISGGRLFHANGPATEKLCDPKPAVLLHGTARSP